MAFAVSGCSSNRDCDARRWLCDVLTVVFCWLGNNALTRLRMGDLGVTSGDPCGTTTPTLGGGALWEWA